MNGLVCTETQVLHYRGKMNFSKHEYEDFRPDDLTNIERVIRKCLFIWQYAS